MFRLSLKGVRSHALRFLLTIFAVTLGVSLVAGTLVLTDSIRSTFDDIFETAGQSTDVVVRGQEAGEVFDGTRLRTPLRVDLVEVLADVDGVSRAVPDIQGTAVLVGKDGTAVRSGGAPTFGFPYRADDPILKLLPGGRAPTGPDEIVVESSTLTRSKLAVGDTTTALIGVEPRTVTITGEATFDAGLAGATIIVVPEDVARTAFAPDGQVQTFSVTAAEGVSQVDLRDRVAAALPAGAEAITGQQFNDENRKQIDEVLGFITIFLGIFAAVSVLVGLFIIFNTFLIVVAQRTRELALLRAVGASRGQVRRMVLGEAVVVGLVGSVLGLGVGIGLAAGLQAFFKIALGSELASGLPVDAGTIAWSFGVGTVATLVAALWPAFRASRVSPVAAMRDDLAPPVKRLRRRGLVGLAQLVVGAGTLWAAVNRDDVAWRQVGVAAALVVSGAVTISPLATRPVVRVIAAPFVGLFGAVGRIARENSLRNPRRTAITAAALMIGLGLMATLSVVAQSTKSSVADLIERQLTADFVLNGGGQAQFPTSVAERVADLPGVASVATIGGVPFQVGEQTEFAIAAEADGIAENIKVDVTAGSVQALDQGQVLVSVDEAADRGWTVGTRLTATIATLRDTPLTVGGIFVDNQTLGSRIVVPRALYLKAVPAGAQGDFLVYVKADDGTDLAAVRQALTDVVRPFVVVSVQDGAEFTASQADQVNTLLVILYILLALSVIIAVLGIINTLALSVFERTREIGLLRAVGLSRRQLTAVISIESVATAVFGAVLGVVLGLGFGTALQRGLRNQGLEVLAIPWGQIALVVALAAVAGLFAAILPAWRAVRLDVLRAITTE